MTKEDNILIAKFMEWRLHEGFNYITPHFQNYVSVGNGLCQTPVHRFEELEFHKSWDWLMPVVERIEETNFVKITRGFCGINETKTSTFNAWASYRIKVQTKGESKIEIVYKTVVEFIKWYNKQKSV
jgi:hypothetical protein